MAMAPTAHDAQAITENVSSGDYVEFMGERFILPVKVAYMAFLIFAKANKSGLEGDFDGMAAMYDMVHGCIAPEDEEHFDKLAIEKRASADELFEFVAEVMEKVSARPIESPGVSTRQAPKTSRKSKASLRLPDGAEDLTPVGDLLH